MEKFQENRILYLLIRHNQRNLAAIVKLEDKKENLDITLSPGITLYGKVLNPDKNGIQNAKIEWIVWTSEISNHIRESMKTDKQGNFQINALPSGFKYTVFAEADGFGRDYVDIQTSETPGDNYELSPIVLQVANLSLSGIVVDSDDKPVPKADIFMEGIGQQIHDTMTDINGRFTIDKICAGEVRIEADKFVKPQLSGHIRAQAGSTNVKIVISEVNSSGQPVQAHSLLNEPLPRIESLFLGFKPEKVRDKKVLICFWDYQQRPSRNCVLQLAKQAQLFEEKDIVVVTIQASKIERKILNEWIEENEISFPVGMIEGNEEKIISTWAVRSLPWLILTDKQHTITAEGFGIAELDEKLSKN